MVPWRSSAALSLARLGDRTQATALAHEEIELAHRWGAQRAIGIAVRAAGIIRDGEKGIELLRQAAEILESSPAPLEHARALTELGAALRRAGHRNEAQQPLRNALDLAHRLGGSAVANQARDELSIAGHAPAAPRHVDATRSPRASFASRNSPQPTVPTARSPSRSSSPCEPSKPI